MPTNNRQPQLTSFFSSSTTSSTATLPTPPAINITDTLRIVLQNPNGIHPHIQSAANVSAHNNLRSLSVGISCLPETNVNWSDTIHRDDNATTHRSYHRASKSAYSSQKPVIRPPSHYHPGGTCTTCLGPWVSRVTHTINDPTPMGRWSGIVLQGKCATSTAIITCYRPPSSSLSSSGPTTSYRRQAAVIASTSPDPSTPNPRQQCLDDLSQFITSHLPSYNIILAIDANEPLDTRSSLLPFLRTTGLTPAPLPAISSTKHGSKQIDHIFVSQHLLPFITSSGALDFDTIYESDHRPYYIDVSSDLFLSPSFYLDKAPHRGLQTVNVPQTQQYISSIEDGITPYTLRLDNLLAEFVATPQDDHAPLITKYNAIDNDVGALLLSSEKASTKPYNNCHYDWSPKLKAAALDLNYLRLQMRRHPHDHSWKARHNLQVKKLKALKAQSRELRQQFLIDKLQSSKPHIINRIIQAEQKRRQFKRVQSLFKKQHQPLTRILYDENVSTSDPSHMETLLIERNQSHLGQAHLTPFTTPPSSDYINMSQQQWESVLTSTIPDSLPHDSRTIISELQATASNNTQSIHTPPITIKEFERTIIDTPERTSSSPSGRHLGHYKAALQSPNLLYLLCQLASLPFQFGFTPTRWTTSIDTMLEKAPGNPHITKLRIIQLLEADFNIGLKIIWARRLKPTLSSDTHLHPAQHGCRPLRSTLAPTVNKIITYDIQRTANAPGLYMENDASAAFDRIIPSLGTLTSYAFGVPYMACQCLLNTALQLKHHIRTGYGISNAWYSATADKPLYGCGQGSGASPIIWLFTINTIISAISRLLPAGTTITNPDSSIKAHRTFDAFVDDTCISVTKSPPADCDPPTPSIIAKLFLLLHNIAQLFANLLYTTGGKLNLAKCHVVSTHAPHHPEPEPLTLTDPSSAAPTTIPTMDPNTAYRTLGFYIAANGSYHTQLAIIREHIDKWITTVSSSHLDNYQLWIAFRTFLYPRITYPLQLAAIPTTQLLTLDQQLVPHLLHSLNLNRHFPRAFSHGPISLGGLALPDCTLYNLSYRIYLLLHFLNLNNDTGSLLKISLDWSQLQLGTSTHILNTSPIPNYVTPTWITSLCDSLTSFEVSFTTPLTTTPPRRYDAYLMDVFIKHPPARPHLDTLNLCRMYLRVIFLSDIADASGTLIDQPYRSGPSKFKPRRLSNLRWPLHPSRPTKHQWNIWTTMLQSTICTSYFSLHHPLGEWLLPTHQIWPVTSSRTTPTPAPTPSPSTAPAYSTPASQVTIGSHLSIYWPEDDTYYPGTVTALPSPGIAHISYDDGDFEVLTLADETFRFLSSTHMSTPPSTFDDYTFYFTPTPTSTPLSLLPTSTKTRQHKYNISNPTTFTHPISHIASFTTNNQHITISTIGPSPPPYTTPPPRTTPFKWKLNNHEADTPHIQPHYNAILSYLQHRKYSATMLSAISHYYPSVEHIEWTGLTHHLQTLSISSRASFVKFQQEWLPTKHHLHRFYPPTQDPLCPLCNEHETQQHVFCCTSLKASTFRATARTTLISNLRKLLPNSLIIAIIAGLQHISDNLPLPDPLLHATSTRSFITYQNTHGWQGLFHCYIPTILYESLTSKPKLLRRTWVSKLIHHLYNYHLCIWKHRNDIVHATSNITDQQLASLQQSVLSWYTRQSELTAAGRALLPEDPSSIRNLSKHSLAELNLQLSSFHAHFLLQPRHTQDIRSFFQPRAT